jgi:hypothetical protein
LIKLLVEPRRVCAWPTAGRLASKGIANHVALRLKLQDARGVLACATRAILERMWLNFLCQSGCQQKLQGSDIPQVSLMHHNLLNALRLDAAISMSKDMGWDITTAAAAFEDPVYQLMPERAAPGAEPTVIYGAYASPGKSARLGAVG